MDINIFLSKLEDVIEINNWNTSYSAFQNREEQGDNYDVREGMKQKGRSLKDSLSLEDRVIGFGLEAYSHFYRSLEGATKQGRKHPTKFSEYFSHWLYSDPSYISSDVCEKLFDWFTKPTPVKINKGCSYWGIRAVRQRK